MKLLAQKKIQELRDRGHDNRWRIFAQENVILGMSIALKLIQERAIYFKSEQKGEGGRKYLIM